MRSINNKFYHSKEWANLRNMYIQLHPLCERCYAKGFIIPAEIVHHKIHLTEDNVNDPSIALNMDNLESVCRDCHNQEHFGSQEEKRWKFLDGKLVVNDE